MKDGGVHAGRRGRGPGHVSRCHNAETVRDGCVLPYCEPIDGQQLCVNIADFRIRNIASVERYFD